MWFKSDISVYDREDFQLAWQECNCLSTVWEWIQRESIKAQDATIKIKNNLYLKGILKKLHISEAELRDAQRLLGEMELIIFDDPNIITLPDWLLKQGSYFAEKKRNASKMADWREKKKGKKEKDVTVTYQLRNSNVTECYSKREDIEKEKEIQTNSARARSPINAIPESSKTDLPSEKEVFDLLVEKLFPEKQAGKLAASFCEEMQARKKEKPSFKISSLQGYLSSYLAGKGIQPKKEPVYRNDELEQRGRKVEEENARIEQDFGSRENWLKAQKEAIRLKKEGTKTA